MTAIEGGVEGAIEGATVVTVLRHGEVAGRAHVYRGSLDEPMSESGVLHLRSVAARFVPSCFDQVATSPLIRCSRFAHDFAAAHNLPLVVLAAFREMHFGDWEGLTPSEAAQHDPLRHRLFLESAGDSPPPGGENIGQFRERVRAGWTAWLGGSPGATDTIGTTGGHRLLVTHAGVMRVLLMDLLGLPPANIWRVALPEAAHFQVSILPGAAPVLLGLNSCAV